jgi:hypothetical protein
MNIIQKLFGPQRITTAANRYYLSQEFAEKAGPPARVERLYAQKDFLRDTWSLYSVADRPMMPVGHIAGQHFLGMTVTAPAVIDTRRGLPEKIAGNLGMREAFDRVRAHEENPPVMKLKTSGGSADGFMARLGVSPGSVMHLVQKKPENDPSYWRNMAPLSAN